MKLVQALKSTKPLFEKLRSLEHRIMKLSAHMSLEGNEVSNPKEKIESYLQSQVDTMREIENLSRRIQKTNSVTEVSIEINGVTLTKTISEWVVRRQKTIRNEIDTFKSIKLFQDRRVNTAVEKDGVMTINKVVYNIDPDEVAKKIEGLEQEKVLIDSALEIANVTTDLID